jgi:uncharacterized membrane protein YkoI
MKIKTPIILINTVLCLGLAAGFFAGCTSEKEDEAEGHSDKQATLMAQAKISKDDAEKIAMAKVPDGTIKEAELEKEHGKLQWSFDMSTPGASYTTEVNVNAIDGTIINVEHESAENEKKEADDKE